MKNDLRTEFERKIMRIIHGIDRMCDVMANLEEHGVHSHDECYAYAMSLWRVREACTKELLLNLQRSVGHGNKD